MKKSFGILMILFLMTSCISDKKLPDAQELLRKELHTIDWTKVDEYPTVDICDTIKGKEENKLCFFSNVADKLRERLLADTLLSEIKGLKTMNVMVTVTKDAEVFFAPEPGDSVHYNVKYINSILRKKNVDFIQIHPAVKRGVPVTTKFVLPITLR